MHTAESLQSCPTLCNPMHCGLSDSSVHEISQVRILEWVACPPPGDLPGPEIKHMSLYISCIISSVQFSRSVVSDSLRPNELQHARLPCPSLSPGVCSNSCPLSWWCHPTISLSVAPFSSCPQFFPASGSFPVSWLFALCGQRIKTSASAPVPPIQDWFPLELRIDAFELWCWRRLLRVPWTARRSNQLWVRSSIMSQRHRICLCNRFFFTKMNTSWLICFTISSH